MLFQINFILNSLKGKFSKHFFSSFLTWTQDRQTDNVEHYIKMPLVRNKRFADAINDTPKLHITRFVWNYVCLCERDRVVCVFVLVFVFVCVFMFVCVCVWVCVWSCSLWVSVCQSLQFLHFNQASIFIEKSDYFDYCSNQILESNACPL